MWLVEAGRKEYVGTVRGEEGGCRCLHGREERARCTVGAVSGARRLARVERTRKED